MMGPHHLNMMCMLALVGWIPLVLALFAFLPPRRAVIYGFLIAWLFLPMAHIPLPGFTDYNKMSAACFGVLLGALIFDNETLFSYRPSLWDIPMAIWCVCPIYSSIMNGLTLYDGVSAMLYQTTAWGLPYFIGRIYFNDLPGLRELMIGIIVGGLVYLPLCWFEMRFSPQLHRWVYGFHQHDFAQTKRYGGWRPMVFMQHGLAVAMWMGSAALCAFWIWRAKMPRYVMGMPMGFAFTLLFMTTVACHSVGACIWMLVGIGVLLLTQWTWSPVWVILLSLIPTTYITLRTTQTWTGDNLIQELQTIDPRGAQSLGTRFTSEKYLAQRALEHPLYGWAGWDRFQAKDDHGNAVGIPDGLWIIALGHNGLIGLISLTLAINLPTIRLLRRVPVRYWSHPGAAPAAAIAILLSLHMCDNLLNGMINPIFILGAGGLVGLKFSLTHKQPSHVWVPTLANRPVLAGAALPPAMARN